MGKNVLIVGKNASAVSDLAETMSAGGFSVAAADAESGQSSSLGGVSVVSWNKGSAVSARSLIIQAETALGYLDDYILYFDSALYAGDFSSFTADNCQKGCDEMVASFQYAALEALTRIEQKKKPARLIFVLKEHPSLKEYLLSSSVKNVTAAPANPFVASGEAAFANFAENIAAYASEKENISVLLITGDLQNEFMQKQSTFASWLKDYINASDELKSKPGIKAAVTWVKAGAKTPGGFLKLF